MNEEQELFYLNEMSRFMYELFDGKTTLQTVFEEMKKEYSIDESLEQDVQADIITIIRDFQWQNIIELTEVSV